MKRGVRTFSKEEEAYEDLLQNSSECMEEEDRRASYTVELGNKNQER